MQISLSSKGSFSSLERFLKREYQRNLKIALEGYGQRGVDALAEATPIDSGMTRLKWGYRVVQTRRTTGIIWFNDNIVDGNNIAILIQYDHGTKNGGFVHGRDYINPAIQPIFEQITQDLWKQVNA